MLSSEMIRFGMRMSVVKSSQFARVATAAKVRRDIRSCRCARYPAERPMPTLCTYNWTPDAR